MTPTLEADDDEFGDDHSVADWVASATPKVLGQSGTPLSGGPQTPEARRLASLRQPTTPIDRLTVSRLAAHQQMRLPGMESPTPTYEPDDETVYGDDASSVASWVASATPRGYDGTNTPMSLPGTPLAGTPQGVFGTGRPAATTPVGEDAPAGFEPGTPLSVAASTPHELVGSLPQPGTPEAYTMPPPPPAMPRPPPITGVRPPPPPLPNVRFNPLAARPVPASGSVGMPTAPLAPAAGLGVRPPPPPAPGASASSSGAAGAAGMPALASEVFGDRGKRTRGEGGEASGEEELPPWKRRAQRRKRQ